MKFSRHLLIGVLALVLGGCGTTVQESLKVAPTVKSTVGADRTVVILPFADYSYADNLESAYRRNLFISENVTDQLSKYSFHLPDDFVYFFIDYLRHQQYDYIVAPFEADA